ncbi:MAG: hypothetical protein H6Q89_3865 [Myxococcaceae bacterium]|nr:hypothetical protein [Myxococcaceae bacterium]
MNFDAVLFHLKTWEAGDRPGQGWALAHCAQSIEFSVTGFPSQKPAWFQKTVGALVLGRFLKKGAMSHDTAAAIPGAADVDRATSAADGAQRLRAAIALFRAHSGELKPHVVYGPVDRARYEAVHSMHIANHLGWPSGTTRV